MTYYKPPTKAELPKLVRDITYERSMLHLTLGWLLEARREAEALRKADPGSDDAAAQDAMANAFLESFLVHARNLVAFFKSKPRTDKGTKERIGDDVFATDYSRRWEQERKTAGLDELGSVVNLINKRVQHITAYRFRVPKKDETSDVIEIAKQIENVWAWFLKSLAPTERAWFPV